MKFCPQCGAQLPANARFCVECGQKIPTKTSSSSPGHISGGHVTIGDVGVLRGNIDASTHVSTHIDSQTNIGGDVNIHTGPKEPSAEDIFAQALSALQLKNYPLAVKLFEQYTAKRPMDADGYYYLALSLLNGNRPRFVSSKTIRQIDKGLQVATSFDSQNGYILLLWAIIKEDHYTLNGMRQRSPTSLELISQITSSVPKKRLKEILSHIYAPGNRVWDWAITLVDG